MRKHSLIILTGIAILFFVVNTYAEIAGGLVFGYPAGLTLRIDNSYIFGIGGWAYNDDNGMILWGDHWIIHKSLPTTSTPLNWYLGIGVELGGGDHFNRYGWNNSAGIGARIPVGLQLPFEKRWEAFFEVVPVMMLLPFYPDINAGIGIRYSL